MYVKIATSGPNNTKHPEHVSVARRNLGYQVFKVLREDYSTSSKVILATHTYICESGYTLWSSCVDEATFDEYCLDRNLDISEQYTIFNNSL
jgi:hypothetical protein